MAERTTSEDSKATLREYRDIVARAIGFVRSQEVVKSFAALSLEELADQQIARIEEPDDTGRPGRLARVTKIKEDLDKHIEAIKETDPDLFRPRDNDRDVNTDREVEE